MGAWGSGQLAEKLPGPQAICWEGAPGWSPCHAVSVSPLLRKRPGKMAPRWCPGKPRPRSAGGGGGAWGRGLAGAGRPVAAEEALAASSPAPFLSGLGWLAALPVSLQQQIQGQSSWLPLHPSVVCLWVSCWSLPAFVSISVSLTWESSSSSSPLSSSLSQVPGLQYGDPKQYS